MVRLIKAAIGLVLILAAAFLALIAAVGAATDGSGSSVPVALCVSGIALVLFATGAWLVIKSASSTSQRRFGRSRAASADSPFRFVTVPARGKVSAHVSNAAEAKLALKELRLLKRQFNLEKRKIAAQKRAIRAQYTHDVRQRGSKFRGGGGVGRFIRSVETASRDSARARLANDLRPLENREQQIKDGIAQVDALVIQIEARLL